MAPGCVFATVGTTQFDQLVSALTSPQTLQALSARGFDHLTLQIGAGSVVPARGHLHGIEVDWFRFRPSLAAEVSAAALVISHAGAGSCLEALDAGRPLIVVPNSGLMADHQSELAARLHADGHVIASTCNDLAQTIRNMDLRSLRPLPPADTARFPRFLESLLTTR